MQVYFLHGVWFHEDDLPISKYEISKETLC